MAQDSIDVDAPWYFCRTPDKLLIEKITDSAKDVADRDRQTYEVKKRIDHIWMFASKEKGGDHGAENSAVVTHPANPDKLPIGKGIEYLPGMGEIVGSMWIIKKDISDSRAKYDTDLYPDKKAVDDTLFYLHVVFFDDVFCKPECTEKSEDIHDAVPVHRDKTQINGYGVEVLINMVPVVHGCSGLKMKNLLYYDDLVFLKSLSLCSGKVAAKFPFTLN